MRESLWGCIVFALLLLALPTVGVGLAQGKEFYTRVDELSCGNARVRAYATYVRGSDAQGSCTDQHFVFSNKSTGAFIKVPASGKPFGGANYEDRMGIWLDALAWRWTCTKGKAGSYVIIDYATGGNCLTCEWREIFDTEGRRLAQSGPNKTMSSIRRFEKKWESLGLPESLPEGAYFDITPRQEDR